MYFSIVSVNSASRGIVVDRRSALDALIAESLFNIVGNMAEAAAFFVQGGVGTFKELKLGGIRGIGIGEAADTEADQPDGAIAQVFIEQGHADFSEADVVAAGDGEPRLTGDCGKVVPAKLEMYGGGKEAGLSQAGTDFVDKPLVRGFNLSAVGGIFLECGFV